MSYLKNFAILYKKNWYLWIFFYYFFKKFFVPNTIEICNIRIHCNKYLSINLKIILYFIQLLLWLAIQSYQKLYVYWWCKNQNYVCLRWSFENEIILVKHPFTVKDVVKLGRCYLFLFCCCFIFLANILFHFSWTLSFFISILQVIEMNNLS